MEETDEALTVCTEIRKKRSEKFQSLSRRKKVFLSPSFVIFFRRLSSVAISLLDRASMDLLNVQYA